jgi:hypothetical protein
LKRVLRIIPLLLICRFVDAFSEASPVEEAVQVQKRIYKMKAVFIFNFTRYIDWPEEKKSVPFRIAVLGRSRITPFLVRISEKKKMGGRTIEIRQLDRTRSPVDAHILFIDSSVTCGMGKLPVSTYPHVLIVGDEKGMTRYGAGISFFIEEGKLKFEINRRNIQKADLFISSQLLKLAHLVE